MNHIEFGIQATIIGISAVFVVLMTVSIVMMLLRRVESRVLSRLESGSDRGTSPTRGSSESFDTLTANEQFLAVAAVDAYRKEQGLSEPETLAAIGAVLEDKRRHSTNSESHSSEENVRKRPR
jgi:Na+-transporting methylmalonyl-CoA/oxaloacetate decarboxylase gamma subunit